jgi:hypothetical protein
MTKIFNRFLKNKIFYPEKKRNKNSFSLLFSLVEDIILGDVVYSDFLPNCWLIKPEERGSSLLLTVCRCGGGYARHLFFRPCLVLECQVSFTAH